MNTPHSTRRQRILKARRAAGGLLMEGFFEGLSRVGKVHPKARRALDSVSVIRDIPYRPTGSPDHTLDIYMPGTPGPWPVVMYAHGGAFRILSKDSHWAMALRFARRGYLVFNINYRLAPKHRFPAATEDACAAWAWVVEHAEEHGGDPREMIVAGESAGGNLATVIALASCYPRFEPYAKAVWDAQRPPDAVIAACGLLQASDCDRFGRRRKLSTFIADRLREVELAYLGPKEDRPSDGSLDLADPLVFLERGLTPARPLPPFFAPVGTRDPILDDTRRLHAALDAMDIPCDYRVYPGEVHAFHAFMGLRNAEKCWRETFAFLDRHSPR